MYFSFDQRTTVDQLIGKTIREITGMETGSDSIKFTCTDGSQFFMYHQQDCCESVLITDVEGDVADLIGLPVVVAEEVSSDGHPPPPRA